MHINYEDNSDADKPATQAHGGTERSTPIENGTSKKPPEVQSKLTDEPASKMGANCR